MGFGPALIWLTAGIFFVYGVGFALAPEALSRFVTDGAPGTTSGLIDMRSTYGGMSIGIGVLLGVTARDPALHALGLRVVALIMACMAGTRVLGISIDASPNAMMWIYLAAEVVACALALVALRSVGSISRST